MKRLILLVVFMALFCSFVAAENATIGIQKIMTAGDTVTVNVSGVQAVVNVVGVNGDAKTAMITINGESKQLNEGATDTLGGIRIYLKQIYSYPIIGRNVAELFIGDEKNSADLVEIPNAPETPKQTIISQYTLISEPFVMTAGDSKTITDSSGNSSVVNVVGVNTDAMSAMITINGESKLLVEGEVFTKAPFNIYLKKIFSFYPMNLKPAAVDLDVAEIKVDGERTTSRVFVPGDKYIYSLKNGNSFEIKVLAISTKNDLVGVEINGVAYSLRNQRFTDLGDTRVYVKQIFEYVMGPPDKRAVEILITDKTTQTSPYSGESEAKPNIYFNFTRNQTSAVYLQNESRYLDSFYLGLNEEKEIIINKTPRKLKLTFFDPATGLSVVKIDDKEFKSQSGRIIELEDSLISLDKVYVSPQGSHLAYFKVVSTLNTHLYQKNLINATKLSCIISPTAVAEGDDVNLTYNGKQYFFKVDKTDTGQGLADITIEKEKVRFYVGQKIYYKDFEVEFADMYLWLSKIPVAVFNVTTCEPVYEEDALRQEISQNKTDAPVVNNSSNIVIEQAPRQEKSFWQKIMDFFANIF